MNNIRTIWQDIRTGENLDVYVTVFLAILVAALGTFGFVDISVVLSTTLAILALVSLSLLSNRRENISIRKSILQIHNPRGIANQFFSSTYDRNKLQSQLKAARSAFFWGLNFTRTLPFLKDDIEYGLQKGLQVRFLMMKPESEAVSVAAFRNRDQNVASVNSTIVSNLMTLANISSRNNSGKLEVRLVNYIPPHTIIAFNPDLPIGSMFVRLTTFRVPNESRPTFELSQSTDKTWFSFFVSQFEAVWENSEPIDLEQYRTQTNQE